MKKHILLTTTAMILSAMAMNANADSNSAQLEMHAWFVKPMELISEKYLGFGMILAGEKDKTVIVTTDGKLDPQSTATMISKASFNNYNNNPQKMAYGSFNEGQIRLKGALDDDLDGETFIALNAESANAVFTINFSAPSVELISSTDSISCGTVSSYTTKFTSEDNDLILHIGGTLTTKDLSGVSRSLQCDGSTTVTLVYNEEIMSTIQNNQPY